MGIFIGKATRQAEYDCLLSHVVNGMEASVNVKLIIESKDIDDLPRMGSTVEKLDAQSIDFFTSKKFRFCQIIFYDPDVDISSQNSVALFVFYVENNVLLCDSCPTPIPVMYCRSEVPAMPGQMDIPISATDTSQQKCMVKTGIVSSIGIINILGVINLEHNECIKNIQNCSLTAKAVDSRKNKFEKTCVYERTAANKNKTIDIFDWSDKKGKEYKGKHCKRFALSS